MVWFHWNLMLFRNIFEIREFENFAWEGNSIESQKFLNGTNKIARKIIKLLLIQTPHYHNWQ